MHYIDHDNRDETEYNEDQSSFHSFNPTTPPSAATVSSVLAYPLSTFFFFTSDKVCAIVHANHCVRMCTCVCVRVCVYTTLAYQLPVCSTQSSIGKA